MPAESQQSSRRAAAADPSMGSPACDDCVDNAPVPAKIAKPRRKRSAQPTYSDGAATRLFKFPSRAYPKSSYYVTSTEVIIRIRKARKKWKLVLPKKRVVSYRTNRWFAKPRWIEVELTYTQALKYGLVEAWTPLIQTSTDDTAAVEAAVDGLAPHIVDSVAQLDTPEEAPVRDQPASDITSQEPDIEVAALVIAPIVAPAREVAQRLRALQQEEGKGEFPPSVSPATKAATDDQPAEAPHWDQPPRSGRKTDRAASPTPDARRGGRRDRSSILAGLMAFVVVALIGGATWWFSADAGAGGRPPSIASAGPSRGNPDKMVAVSEQSAAVPLAEQTLGRATDEAAPSPVPTDHALQRDDETANVDTAAISESGRPTPGPVQPPTREDAREDVLADDLRHAAAGVQQLPASYKPKRETDADICRIGVAAVIQTASIRFDYGSSNFPQSGFEALDRLAMQLRTCGDVAITITGHTDSDGHFTRNQRLSLRRADVVRQLLIDAGIEPSRLQAVGFGQLRPLAPNDTEINKSRNRRIEVIVGAAAP